MIRKLCPSAPSQPSLRGSGQSHEQHHTFLGAQLRVPGLQLQEDGSLGMGLELWERGKGLNRAS